jgi:hypothetical protein
MTLKGVVRNGIAAAGLLGLIVSQAAPADAVTFAYSQSTGFRLGSATTGNVFGTSAAQLNSGIEFFDPADNPNPALHLGDNSPPPNTFSTIGWGCTLGGANCAANDGDANTVVATSPHTGPNDAARSSLFLVGLAGTISDDGVPVIISHIEHDNTPITGRALGSVKIDSLLRFATEPNPTTDAQTIDIFFTETLNRAPCPAPNPQGSVCDDFFVFSAGDSLAPLIVEHQGQKFKIEFSLVNLTNATFDPTTGTIFTAEGVTSSLEVAATMTPVVPEPTTLLLLGTGLIGIGAAATKRGRTKK